MRPRTDGHWRRNLFFPSLCSHWTFRAPQWVAGRRRRRRRRRAKKTFGVCSHAAVVVDFSIFGQPGKNFRPARTSNTNKRLGWFGFIRTHLAHRIRLFWDFWCQNSNRNPAGRSRTRFHLFPFRLPVSSRPSKSKTNQEHSFAGNLDRQLAVAPTKSSPIATLVVPLSTFGP